MSINKPSYIFYHIHFRDLEVKINKYGTLMS